MNKELGQFFTPPHIVKQMVDLIRNDGSILEPSAGDGAFLKALPKHAVGVEIDPQYASNQIKTMDFFDYEGFYDTIIGNPPYIKYQEISVETKNKLPKVLDKRSNLYLFFIWKSIDMLHEGGELIFIIPRDFIKNTSAIQLNHRLFTEGGFSYWEEHGDARIFNGATPNTCIFRWVKGGSHSIPVSISGGLLSFSDARADKILVSSVFDVLVGGASGANKIFYAEEGNIDLVVSTTVAGGKTKKAFYVSEPVPYLENHKETLLNRKIKQFNESNWFEWGRKIRVIDKPRIYVNMKTRVKTPFYTHPSLYFDGSVLALIPKNPENFNIQEWLQALNSNDWAEEGLLVGDRFIFGQKSLSNAYVSFH